MVSCDVSIECAHVYADESFTERHSESVAIAKRVARRLQESGKTVRSLVLLDDIHVTRAALTPHEIRRGVTMCGHLVDAVVNESSLIHAAKRLIATLPRRRLYFEPFRRAPKRVLFLDTPEGGVALGSIAARPFEPTCALLVATWNLARLGEISVPEVPTAREVTSVLEERYRAVERKAALIMNASPYRAAHARLTHVFY